MKKYLCNLNKFFSRRYKFGIPRLYHILTASIGVRTVSVGKIAVCCIAKSENEYIREWVEHYCSIGFDKIIIYDNNDVEGERFDTVIGDYINAGTCEILDYRGRQICQLEAYNECYVRHGREYDWIAFFDCDEFMTIVKHKNAKHFLSDPIFDNYQMIHINWLVYNDNEMLDTDGRPIQQRLISHIPYNHEENTHIKTIVRGGLRQILFLHTPHSPDCYYRCCNPVGSPVASRSYRAELDYTTAFLKHFAKKTIGEFVRIKMKRGYPDMSKKDAKAYLTVDGFFYYNVRTKEKEEYAKQLLLQMNK